jgi:hypothetical protein
MYLPLLLLHQLNILPAFLQLISLRLALLLQPSLLSLVQLLRLLALLPLSLEPLLKSLVLLLQ